MKMLKLRLSYANVVATLALVIAVGGGSAYAARYLSTKMRHPSSEFSEQPPRCRAG